MEHGIAQLAIIPIRGEAAHRYEQVSQLLFGETYRIIEWLDEWVKIATDQDDYEGYVSRGQVTTLSADDHTALLQAAPVLTHAPITVARRCSDGSDMLLPAGCTLPFFENGTSRIDNEVFEIPELVERSEDLIATAKTFLNTFYLWGGRTHFGIDCSGFAQNVFKQHGIKIRRDAYQQAEQGTTVDFLPEAKAGDLAFFDNEQGRITHVGIMMDNEHIIHASGRVKIDRVDGQGIYSEELKKHTHKLRIIKRYF
ncbi:C40 family peptidase [Mucilaginibacter daejeonensis]|uniref:C40 family peptidase n=1 Tax=Mucilaginibacter daejeonensis TaxID=398049 RepID=UPI001D1746D6|nr:C40 family peptidase [Mucilaginibacter daejeonensis]UEG52038.1 C40 family peptidase [Mucilaginibacter daejeonensis]